MTVLTAQSAFAALAILSSVALAAGALRRRPWQAFRVWFALGMTAFAAESLAALMLVQHRQPALDVVWIRLFSAASLLGPLLWTAFVFGPSPRDVAGGPLRWLRFGIAAAGGLGLAVLATVQDFGLIRADGVVEAITFDLTGVVALVVEVLATVAVLAGLERCLGRIAGFERWRLKYLIVGLGAIFLARFFVLSNALLFRMVTATHIESVAAFTALGNIAIAFSRARGMGPIKVVPSRQVVFGSTVVSLLGVYLLAVGCLGWALRRLAIPKIMFWMALLMFVAGVVLAVLLLSDRLRWRLRRFIAFHFYRSKYDYREQWRAFTARLGSLLTVGEQAPKLLEAVADTVGATEATLYVWSEVDDRFRRAAVLHLEGAVPVLDGRLAFLERIRKSGPLTLEPRDLLESDDDSAVFLSHVALAVPLVWSARLVGVIFLGPERTGAPYTAEDVEFLATVGEQAAGALQMAELVEAAAQAREFDAFHRITSFVIHDIKNSVSALSMLSRNALDHFDDPEFQRDAIRTISATVGRMKALLGKLGAPVKDGGAVGEGEVEVDGIAAESLAAVPAGPGVRIVTELEPALVLGDGELLRKVVENLVGNAMDALKGHGTLRLRTLADGDSAVIEVSDDGVGMSDEYVRDSLFVPFRSTKPGGWGIGLYQAREIVRKHHGQITVTSRLGQGTTFRVTLPLRCNAVDQSEPREAAGGRS